jgi:hypothetical protein
MSRITDHRATLSRLPAGAWDAYLTEHSGLPGPRANLELVAAAAEELPADRLRRYASSPDEFLALCGATGLGRLAAEGRADAVESLRSLAGDPRWRVREGVAMGLQRLGDADPAGLRRVVTDWAAESDPLVLRAAAAGICEPRLLSDPQTARVALDVVDRVTVGLLALPGARRRSEDARVLRKALGYCWSVAVAASPAEGFDRLERLAALGDADGGWIVRENLRKARLARADPDRHARLARTVS